MNYVNTASFGFENQIWNFVCVLHIGILKYNEYSKKSHKIGFVISCADKEYI